jgi:iron complex outermembrane receptor protein
VGTSGYINNLTSDYYPNEFQAYGNIAYSFLSDLYVENASFIRMDNASIGYNVGSIFNDNATLSIAAIVQNVFLITNYSGIDPEIAGGIDRSIYPRPRIYSLNLNLKI